MRPASPARAPPSGRLREAFPRDWGRRRSGGRGDARRWAEMGGEVGWGGERWRAEMGRGAARGSRGASEQNGPGAALLTSLVTGRRPLGRVRRLEHEVQVQGDCADSGARRSPTPSEGFRGAVPAILATPGGEPRAGCRGRAVDASEEPAHRAAAASRPGRKWLASEAARTGGCGAARFHASAPRGREKTCPGADRRGGAGRSGRFSTFG